MKKVLLFLFLISLMTIPVVANAMAGSVYVDLTAAGQWQNDQGDESYDDDLSQVTCGTDLNFNKIKAGFEYASGTEKSDIDDYDFTQMELKGGYQVFANDQFKLYYIIAYNELNYEDSDQKINGIFVGADAVYSFNKKVSLEGSLGLSVNGATDDGDTEEDVKLLNFKTKLNYYFSDHWGVNLGCRYYNIDFDERDDSLTYSGLTLGGFYKW